jgi:Do/DeqQ family serine protease
VRALKMPVLVVGALLLGLPLAAAQQDGSLGGILKDLLGGGEPETALEPVQPERRVPFGRAEMQLSFAPLVRETAPAVVNVYASQQVRARSPFAGDPFFERFFGGGRMPPREQSSLGSGVIVDASGIVVTNYHVIRDADDVKVALPDGREFVSKMLLKDERVDLAVLKIEAGEPFPTVPIGDSDALQVGDLVLAMGNPFGVGQTTTSGIVSALARNRVGISDFGFFIQTDAAINPGNSGGALIDMAGRLVGINTAIYSRGGGSNGIGFAIPSNMVRAVVEAARGGRDYFERPYIGAGFEQVTAELAEALGMTRPSGALVTSVESGGPAARAGLRPGDVILKMNGGAIEHVDALGYRLSTHSIGSAVKLEILRQGRLRETAVTLEREPEGGLELVISGRNPFAGARVADLDSRAAGKLGLARRDAGVVVVDVARNSPAESVGFQPRDIIREVNGQEIAEVKTLSAAVARQTRNWRFTVERDGQLMSQFLRF